MLRKRKQEEKTLVREGALAVFLDSFFTYDEDHNVYVMRSGQVGGEYMEEFLDFVAVNGTKPTLTDLCNDN
jgi:hypothetical protein